MFRLIVIQTGGSPMKTDWRRRLLRRCWSCIFTFPFSLSKRDSKSAFQLTVRLHNNSQQETDLFFVYFKVSWDLFCWSLSKKSRPRLQWRLSETTRYAIALVHTTRNMHPHFKYPLAIPATQKNHTKRSFQRGHIFGPMSENGRYPASHVAPNLPSRTLRCLYPYSDTIVSVMELTSALLRGTHSNICLTF
jgi:hypothetical protein